MSENTQPENTTPEPGLHGPGCDCPALPEDHSTVTLHMVMGTPAGDHAMELTVKFPKDMGLTAATALGTKMNDVIGPSFMAELRAMGDAQYVDLAKNIHNLGPSLN